MTILGTMLLLIIAGKPAVTNANNVEYRWWADDLDPPACTVQMSNHGAEVVRVSIAYIDHASFRMQLSVLVGPQSHFQAAERVIVGCVSVKRVVAEQLTTLEAKNMRPTKPAAIISRR